MCVAGGQARSGDQTITAETLGNGCRRTPSARIMIGQVIRRKVSAVASPAPANAGAAGHHRQENNSDNQPGSEDRERTPHR